MFSREMSSDPSKFVVYPPRLLPVRNLDHGTQLSRRTVGEGSDYKVVLIFGHCFVSNSP